jgi:polar amino acid transport system permease protein
MQGLNVRWLDACLVGGLILAFLLLCVVAEAQSGARVNSSPVETLIRWIPVLLWQNGNGFVLNLTMSFLAMGLGTIAGVGAGLMLVSRIRAVRVISWLIVRFFRNSPWLVILFAVMMLTPFEISLGGTLVRVPDWLKAVFGFSLPIMANVAEIVRGAVQSIPIGQWESAESLCFTRFQTMRMIILPQCIKRMIPPWMNWYAILTMSTPIASVLGVHEAVSVTQQVLVAENSRPELLGVFYGFLLLVFFLYCYPIAYFTGRLERRYAVLA